MQIVTDTGMDLYLPPEELPNIPIHIIRHAITLSGKTYLSGKDIQSDELYRRLAETGEFPTTSQPAAGEYAAMFRKLAQTDPDILCIPMSSGLSGSVNAAQAAVEMVPEANITIVDSKMLSGVLGWQVSAAARAIEAGWPTPKIVQLVKDIVAVSNAIYTLDDLKYLIHGGRISHMKGLIASVLRIKPIIGVAKDSGAYEQLGQARTFKRAIQGLVKYMGQQHARGTAMRVQIIHAYNEPGVALLRKELESYFDCHWLPVGYMSPVLGAHTGTTMVGIGYAALADYPDVP